MTKKQLIRIQKQNQSLMENPDEIVSLNVDEETHKNLELMKSYFRFKNTDDVVLSLVNIYDEYLFEKYIKPLQTPKYKCIFLNPIKHRFKEIKRITTIQKTILIKKSTQYLIFAWKEYFGVSMKDMLRKVTDHYWKEVLSRFNLKIILPKIPKKIKGIE